ncbi:hypothetical protein [Thalassospira alkalitolerans]|uniref:Uncharacterized protein n=1 Tax=Thalassospira alkalitolerans TaxID=1293890 RepID=A0A1Y2LF94_9PROT|nr:hypothetical protein [Thalassospira alkalitolerans]OSQ49989.1 hypothetical protein TALK_00270 [Thalassospira alkalitolerans]
MSDQSQEAQKKPNPINNMHKLILFGSSTLLLGTLLLMVTVQAALEMMMHGRSAGSFIVVIGTAVAIGLLVAGSTIISKWVSRKVQAILEE